MNAHQQTTLNKLWFTHSVKYCEYTKTMTPFYSDNLRRQIFKIEKDKGREDHITRCNCMYRKSAVLDNAIFTFLYEFEK